MKKNLLVIFSLLFIMPLSSWVNALPLQSQVPAVSISDKGELNLHNGKFSYTPWNSAQLIGKVRVIQHIAGRTSAKELNAELIEALKQAHLPHDRYQTTTIINTDDAIIGTASFVRSSIEESKESFPWSQFIVDSNGVTKDSWHLKPKGSAIIVLDKQGKIQFFKDGHVNSQQVQQVVALLHQLLQKG